MGKMYQEETEGLFRSSGEEKRAVHERIQQDPLLGEFTAAIAAALDGWRNIRTRELRDQGVFTDTEAQHALLIVALFLEKYAELKAQEDGADWKPFK